MNALVHIQANFKQYDSGILERLPWILPTAKNISEVESLSRDCVKAIRSAACMSETDSNFSGIVFGPSIAATSEFLKGHLNDVRSRVECAMTQVSNIIDNVYGVDSRPLREIVFGVEDDEEVNDERAGDDDKDNEENSLANSASSVAQSLISLCVGRVMGRWKADVFLRDLPFVPDNLFEALPSVPPAALVSNSVICSDDSGEGNVHNSDGIIVDDADNPSDIVSRVRTQLENVWDQQSDAIESEICEILGVKELRDYFRKPGKGGFWDDHVSRYSKSRRKAPIYWLLQSSKKNYALWLYYHRLDKDLLFKALVNYVEPKIRLETSRLETLRSQKAAAGETGKEAKRLAKEVERQEDFLSELRDFEDKLRRAANLHLEPDLNDGVVLNIAPLHELVPWKEAKSYWDELLEGKYEWSSIGKQLRQKGLVK